MRGFALTTSDGSVHEPRRECLDFAGQTGLDTLGAEGLLCSQLQVCVQGSQHVG